MPQPLHVCLANAHSNCHVCAFPQRPTCASLNSGGLLRAMAPSVRMARRCSSSTLSANRSNKRADSCACAPVMSDDSRASPGQARDDTHAPTHSNTHTLRKGKQNRQAQYDQGFRCRACKVQQAQGQRSTVACVRSSLSPYGSGAGVPVLPGASRDNPYEGCSRELRLRMSSRKRISIRPRNSCIHTHTCAHVGKRTHTVVLRTNTQPCYGPRPKDMPM